MATEVVEVAMVPLEGTEKALAELMKASQLQSEAAALVGSARERSLLRLGPGVTEAEAPIQPPLGTTTARTRTSARASVRNNRGPRSLPSSMPGAGLAAAFGATLSLSIGLCGSIVGAVGLGAS